MSFLLESFWILCTYGAKYSGCGLALSSLLVIWGFRRVRRGARMAVPGAASLVLWLGLFLGVESGYYSWKSIPDPPSEAFSDTGGPFFILFLGWLPSLVLLGIGHLLLRHCWRKLKPPVRPPDLPPAKG